ncbi:hypothetical protein [Mucilaginibacter xinganensis]|uniref:Gliding motility protein GldL n=1 Tax=Mucilaginibacter xinganensis TaxID=1234841 RepID=A0A223P497_9SPHI|nr:hypothetical protein [Mucilaginibacter xinganensis]ASU36668.1 hypothetical protein MuYL_4785 [Mucilaginibacter xinganensis]
MFFNFRNPVILFMLSIVGLMIGLAFKVMHWPGGKLITGSMIMVQAISIIWLIIIVVKSPKQ